MGRPAGLAFASPRARVWAGVAVMNLAGCVPAGDAQRWVSAVGLAVALSSLISAGARFGRLTVPRGGDALFAALFGAWVACAWAVRGFSAAQPAILSTMLAQAALYLLVRASEQASAPAAGGAFRDCPAEAGTPGPAPGVTCAASRYQAFVVALVVLHVSVGVCESFFIRGRAAGLTPNPNQFGALMAAGVPLSIGLWMSLRGRGCLRSATAFAVALSIAGLVLSGSLGGVLGVSAAAVSVAAALCLKSGRWPWAAVCAAALCVPGLLVGRMSWNFYTIDLYKTASASTLGTIRAHLVGNTSSERPFTKLWDLDGDGRADARDLVLIEYRYAKDPSLPRSVGWQSAQDVGLRRWWQMVNHGDYNMITRLTAAKACVLMWAEHPVWGVGPGNYYAVSHRYLEIIEDSIQLSPHCIPLQLLAELGFMGFLGWMVLLPAIFVRISRLSDRPGWVANPATWMGVALAAAWIQGLVDGTWLTHPMKTVVPVLAALLVTDTRTPAAKHPTVL